MRKLLLVLTFSLLACGLQRTAQAIPILQVYVEGATYDPAIDTWVAQLDASNMLRVWVIGNVGDNGPIIDVKMSIAYPIADTLSFGLASTTTGGLGGFNDPSTPLAPTFNGVMGGTPTLSDGSSLPGHGVYGPSTQWAEFLLGDFTLTDSPIANFITSFPAPHARKTGQINVYDLTVTGTPSQFVHIDIYNHVEGANHSLFASPSHDGESTPPRVVPEPSSIVVWGLGLAAILGLARFRRRKTV